MTPSRLGLKEYLLLAVLALAFSLPGLTSLPPIDRDEPRYTQATTQMLETGDFLDIRFMDQVRYKQPAGIYWIQAAAVSAFGDVQAHKIWAHRLPSVLAGLISVLLTASIAAAFFGRRAGLAAGVLMASCLSLTFESHIAKTDAVLCALILSAQACLVRLRLDQSAREPSGWVAPALFWLFLGLGVMVKGPIPVMVLGLTLACISIWDRSWDLIRRLRIFPLILIPLAIAIPWLIAIQIKSHGEFLKLAGGQNFAGKIASGQESHGAPPGYHLLLLNGMFWPSALFAVAGFPAVWRSRRDPRMRFLLSWLLPAWVIFEASATKLPHYPLPTYPALAIMAAGVWFSYVTPQFGRKTLVFQRIYAGVWTVIGLLLSAAPAVFVWMYDKRIDAISIGLGCGAAAFTIATLVLFLRKRLPLALGAASAAALLAWGNFFGWSAPHLQALQLSPRVAAAIKANAPCPKPTLASAPFQEASLAYLAGTGTQFVDPAKVADHLAADPACGLALIGAKEYPAFAAQLGADHAAAARVAEIDGLNYANGDKLKLGLYRAAPAIPAAESSPSAASPKTLP